jgi:hypothetical protein
MVSRMQKARVLGVEVLFRLPSRFFFCVMTPLYLGHPYGLSSGLSLLSIQHRHGVLDEREIRPNLSISFRDHLIFRHMHTFL